MVRDVGQDPTWQWGVLREGRFAGAPGKVVAPGVPRWVLRGAERCWGDRGAWDRATDGAGAGSCPAPCAGHPQHRTHPQEPHIST